MTLKGCIRQIMRKMLIGSGISLQVVSAGEFEDSLQALETEKWRVADGWGNGYPFVNDWDDGAITFNEQGMAITLMTQSLPKTPMMSGEIRSHGFYGYGCFEVDMKPIKAPGVVSSFFLFSGPHDKPEDGNGIHNEIDIEFLGSNTNMVQLNFWTDDDAYENSHESLVFLPFDASKSFHRYSIDWSEKGIDWLIDGKLVLRAKNNKSDPTPSVNSSKLRIMKNVWVVDRKLSNWAGKFKLDKKKTYSAYYKNFKYTPNKKCSL
ncbi:family 16 glycosylhydrolase [Vibrio maerlii]|uniref:family 16 glycosylhydrolase n=1 Tax=Vibrio maerlii TaxID=2231648 RepID=UPI001F130D96|nr:family 16 glycosylhydrolase [Vibrio maerlii]